jgi:Domain of unknown function (DUF4149)
MQTILRTIEFLALGLWLGSDTFLGFVVAPGAFSVLANRDTAGMLVGYALTRLHYAGIFLGLLFLLARFLRTWDLGSLASSVSRRVALMVVLTAVSQFALSNRMQQLKQEMVSVQNTPTSDPRRAEFDRLHRRSVALEGAVLLLGLSGMFLMVRESMGKN